MDSKIVIFGAAGGGIKTAETLKSFGIDFYCFVDNDKNKWGTVLLKLNKKIFSPDILISDEYKIIIASEHQVEIEKQLEEMGIISNLILKEDLIIPYIDELYKNMYESFNNNSILNKERMSNNRIIIDLAEGVKLGGIESWTYTVASELVKLGIDVEVFAKKTDAVPPKCIRDNFKYFDLEYCDFKENIYSLALEILNKSPCTVIINKHTQIFYAAYIAKQLCSDSKITIISVIHSDTVTLYRRQKKIEKMTDLIFCVSKRIRKKLIQDYNIPIEKVFYKESPVLLLENGYKDRDYTENVEEPIKIGYAGRLVKFSKRADLIPKLIGELDKRNCNYLLAIAGDGSYINVLKDFIKKNNLSHKVYLAGKMDQREISFFWKKQDIFISLSDYEGSSISALEAMGQGVVPVETDVSGTDEFVENGINGYIVPIGDVGRMAECILELDKHREKLHVMGSISRKKIEEKCKPDDYGKYIIKLSKLYDK